MTLRRFLLVTAVVVFAATMMLRPGAAQAAPALSPSAAKPAPAGSAAAAAIARGNQIVAAARAQQGKPYRYGAHGPSAFDCSGLTGYVYAKVRIKLPRTAQAQYTAAKKISKAAARPGDLVFWVSGGHAYHVAVYAGGGRVWHAPKPGDRVKLGQIWSWNQVRFGRIGG